MIEAPLTGRMVREYSEDETITLRDLVGVKEE